MIQPFASLSPTKRISIESLRLINQLYNQLILVIEEKCLATNEIKSNILII